MSVSKRVNRIAHPDQDGESSQDLGLSSFDYPITLYFDGPDHDLEAKRFSDAVAERGVWSVTHPVLGLLYLQPVKFTIKIQPVESGNITEINSDWFSPYTDKSAAGQGASGTASTTAGARSATPVPVSDPAAAVQSAVATLSETALTDAAQITQDTATATQSAARQFGKNLQAVRSLLHGANARITGIMGTINDLTMQTYLDIASLSGAVIQLAESPGLFMGNIASRVSMFCKLGRRILTDLPAALNFSASQINAVLTGELWLNAVSCGLGLTITESLPETRVEALSVLRQYRDFVVESRNALDAMAKATAANPIEAQYFPRITSAEAVLTLNAAIAKYVTGAAFDLKTEKRIVLQKPTSPLLLAIAEYGAGADRADAAYDLLCRSNNLHGLELLLLPRQKEVVVYQ